MALRGQNHGVYRSKVWHFWVVTHIATLKLRQDNGLQTTDYGHGGSRLDYTRQRTTDNGQRSGGSRWSFAGATSDNGLQTTDYGGR